MLGNDRFCSIKDEKNNLYKERRRRTWKIKIYKISHRGFGFWWNVNEMRILCEIRNTGGKIRTSGRGKKKKQSYIVILVSTFHFAGIPKLEFGERVNCFNLPPVVHLSIPHLRTLVDITHVIIYTILFFFEIDIKMRKPHPVRI